ncbi:MAG: fibronectin type III domain-containing protein [Candidatus Korobacteraceae bacterium]
MRNRTAFVHIVVIGLLWCAAGCGAPGVPMPPSLALPRPLDDLAAMRKGGRVVLTWTEPTQTTDRQRIRRMGPTVICRVIGEFPMKECRVIKQLRPEDLHSVSAVAGKPSRVMFEDALSPEIQSAEQFATYAVEVRNRREKSAGLSNQVRVSLAPSLPAPNDLRAEATPESVVLSWTAPELLPSAANLRFFYRVFRKLANAPDYTLIQELPARAGTETVSDRSFVWEHAYDYKVASVTRVQPAGGEPMEFEGNDSPIVHIFPHDIFPPAIPTGLQAVFSGVGQKPFIDLTWAPNTEADLAGYDVFRSELGESARQINRQLVKAPAFRDEDVVAGHRYIYSVSAVDERGNKSARSETAVESVPQP